MSDPKYNADPHSIYLQQGIPISVVNVSESQLNNIYKLNLQKKVYVTIENTHPRGGNESARIAIKANYVMPKMDKNNNFVRDANGNIVIDYKDGNYLKNYYIAQKMKDNGITNKDVAMAIDKKKILNMLTQGEGKATKDIIKYSDVVETGIREILGDSYREILSVWSQTSDLAHKLDWSVRDDKKSDKNITQFIALFSVVQIIFDVVWGIMLQYISNYITILKLFTPYDRHIGVNFILNYTTLL